MLMQCCVIGCKKMVQRMTCNSFSGSIYLIWLYYIVQKLRLLYGDITAVPENLKTAAHIKSLVKSWVLLLDVT